MLDLSIVIVNYRSWDKLTLCLDSLLAQGTSIKEIIVSDNFSDDGQLMAFRVKYPSIHWQENKCNGGFAYGCNQGTRIASGKWLLFLNPDTELPSDTLTSLIPYCEKNAKDHLITIKQVTSDGKPNYPFGIFPNALNQNGLLRSFERLFIKPKQGKKRMLSQRSAFPDWIAGSFVLLRKTDFIRIGNWDERFWMYYEDIDYSMRAHSLGIKRVVLNDWTCIHNHGGASRKNFKTKVLTKTHVLISAHNYLDKHLRFPNKQIGQFILFLGCFFNTIVIPTKTKRAIFVRLLAFWFFGKFPNKA